MHKNKGVISTLFPQILIVGVIAAVVYFGLRLAINQAVNFVIGSSESNMISWYETGNKYLLFFYDTILLGFGTSIALWFYRKLSKFDGALLLASSVVLIFLIIHSSILKLFPNLMNVFPFWTSWYFIAMVFVVPPILGTLVYRSQNK